MLFKVIESHRKANMRLPIIIIIFIRTRVITCKQANKTNMDTNTKSEIIEKSAIINNKE